MPLADQWLSRVPPQVSSDELVAVFEMKGGTFTLYNDGIDDCISARLPWLSLNWHYRSRHESLIAFSRANRFA